MAARLHGLKRKVGLFRVLFLLIWLKDCQCLAPPSPVSFCRCEKAAYADNPFVAIWNSPTGGCKVNFSIPIELRKYGIYENDQQAWDGKMVTVFYGAQLGLYPYITVDGKYSYNNGLPQLVDLQEHLRHAEIDIVSKIPNPHYQGLAVIDWEPWRPLWKQNWNAKKIYKIRSVQRVKALHPDWSADKLLATAKTEFETAARTMFVETIELGKRLRPKAYWGFYGYPDCYGHKDNHYQCTEQTMQNNDELGWLFDVSTALFPSIYLVDTGPENKNYVLGKLREAFRAAMLVQQRSHRSVPVFPYFRELYVNYVDDYKFLSLQDLKNTIGVAADLGSSGIVMWGNRNDENTSPQICHRINNYLASTLGPYVKRLQNQVKACSGAKCRRGGMCVYENVLGDRLHKMYQQMGMPSICFPTPALKKRDNIPKPLGKHLTHFNSSVPKHKHQSKLNYTVDLGTKHSPNKTLATSAIKILAKSPVKALAKSPVKTSVNSESKVQAKSPSLQVMLKSSNVSANSRKDVMGSYKHQQDLFTNQTRKASTIISGKLRSVDKAAHLGSDSGKGKSFKHRFFILPHMYVILVGVSLGGALMFSLVFLFTYYYMNLRRLPHAYPGNTHESSQTPDVKKANRIKGGKKKKKEKQEKGKSEHKEKEKRKKEEGEVEVDLHSL